MSRCLRTRTRIEIEPIKGSRFVATAVPVADEHAARAALAGLQTEWPDATHHCWGWRLASPAIDRAGDDGEPSGSAGRPILAAIAGRDLVDTAVIVTRWFGGTKLGVGGLVRAYGGAAAAVLDAAPLDEWVSMTELVIEHEHADTGAVERALAAAGVAELDVEWGTVVRRTVTVAVDAVDELRSTLAEATNGRVSPRWAPDRPGLRSAPRRAPR